ncbi:MAG TPA: DUF86 domain-containing protein [Terriglobia bacterium]|nr:DUF86 domain-containing protein [Terriglobia bacterium]
MWRDDARLLDMLLAARELDKYTEHVSFEAFESNRLLQHAVVRLIEIVGEAARNVSTEFKAAHPEIPWSGIVGMRNRLIHEYFRVAPDKVWEVVKKDMATLVALIEPLVPPENAR